MGVSGLWEIVNKASQTRSVAHLAVVDGFEKNEHGTRTLRVGIDASLWLQHATAPWIRNKNPNAANARGNRDVGSNPELRTLFFRLAKWSKLPVSLLFVFDGRERPKVKRGSRMGKSGSHLHARGFKELIGLFGWDWREARGEAEAELAFLNQVGAIDAVVTDDIDCLIFGARVVLKNFSLHLSGNRADPPKDANGKGSIHHAHIYTADEIRRHPDVELTRGGLVLFALMSGGDYDDGLFRCGPSMAHAMARQRFGEELIQAYERYRGSPNFVLWLEQWRQSLQAAIRANSQGLMSRASPNFVIPQDWPKVKTIELYVNPLTSASDGGAGNGGGPPRDRRPVDLPGLAWFCEKHFEEWGYKSAILKRFSNLLTHGLVLHVLRHAALEADRRERERQIAHGRRPGEIGLRGPLRPRLQDGVGTSATLVKSCLAPKARGGGYAAQREIDMQALRAAFARPDTPEPEDRNVAGPAVEHVEDTHPLVVEITRTRQHASTDKLLEYRVRVCPRQLIAIAESGIRGMHPEPGPRKRTVMYAEDEPDDTDEEEEDPEEGNGTRKKKKGKGKKTDPNDDVLLWIPATIMQQVHPALVQDWEETRNGRARARGANANPAPRQRAAAVRQAAPHAPDLPPAVPAASSQPAAAPAPARGGRGKGKARARPNDEYDYLSINPYASFAPPKEDFNPMAQTSLPFRVCGFMFTWPDPDDPDQLIVDTYERGDLPTKVNYREVENAGVFGEYGSAAVSSQGAPKRTQARVRSSATTSAAHRQPAAGSMSRQVDDHVAPTAAAASASSSGRKQSQANAARPRKRKQADRAGGNDDDNDYNDEPWVEPEDDGRNRFSRFASQINAALGIGENGEPIPIPKRKKARGRRPRASAQEAAPTPTSVSKDKGKGKERATRDSPRPPSRTKRRKTLHEDAAQIAWSSAEPGPSTIASTSTSGKRVDPLFLDSDSDSRESGSPSPFNAAWPSSSPAPPPPSSALPTPSKSRSIARVNLSPLPSSSQPSRPKDDDVISISSDSEDERIAADQGDLWGGDWLNFAPFNGEASFYSQRKARESQQSLGAASIDIDSDAEADDAMDLDGVEPASVTVRGAESKPGDTRYARSVTVPSSSQESALGDGNAGDFFRDVTVVRSLK